MNDQPETTVSAAAETDPGAPETATAAPAASVAPAHRRQHRYAAPLGFAITLLALVGVVALVIGGISLIRRWTDTSALQQELLYFLEPITSYNPDPFDDITQTEQDAFLNAAAYRVSVAEQIRMLREGDENCIYAVDDQGRIAVPVAQIEESYRALFGAAAPLTHRTLSEDGLTYSEAGGCYYVPFDTLNNGYETVVASLSRKGKTYTIRIGYVAINDILLDEHGNEIPPTADMATFFQTYTVVRADDGLHLTACADA